MTIDTAARKLRERTEALMALTYDDLSDTDVVTLTPDQQDELRRASDKHRSGEHALDLAQIAAAPQPQRIAR